MRAWVLALLLVAAAIAGTGWLLRDVPRGQVERVLGERFGGRARLGSLELLSARHVVLHDLRLEDPQAFSSVSSVRIDRVDAVGDVTDLIDARFERLVLGATQVVLEVPQEAPAEGASGVPAEAPSATAKELVLKDVTVRVGGRASSMRLTLRGALEDWGGSFRGLLSLRGRALDAAPWSALAGQPMPEGAAVRAERFEAVVRVAEGGRNLQLRGGLTGVAAAWRDEPIELSRAEFAAELATPPEGGPSGALALELGDLGRWRCRFAWDPDGAWPALELLGRGLDPAAAQASLPAGLSLAGKGTGEVLARLAPDGSVSARVFAELPPAVLERNGERVHLVRTGLKGSLRFRLRKDGSVDRIEAEAEAVPAVGPPLSVEGHVRREEAAWRIALDGSVPDTTMEGWWRALEAAGVDPASLPWLSRATGGVELRGRVEGPLDRPGWRLDAYSRDLALSGEGWRLRDGSGELRLRGEGLGEPMRAELRLSAEAGWGSLAPRALELDASAELGGEPWSVRVENARMRVQQLGEMGLAGRWTGASWWIEVTHGGVGLSSLTSWLAPVVPAHDGWERPGGELAVDVRLDGRGSSDVSLAGELSLADAAWSSADGTRAFQGLSGRWDLDGTWIREGLTITAAGDVTGPLLLWRSAFGDFGGLSVATRGRLDWSPTATDSAWSASLGASFPEGVSVAVEARRGADGGTRLTGRLHSDALGTAYRRLVLEPFAGGAAETLPDVSGGTLDFQAGWTSNGAGAQPVSGRLRLQDVGLAGREAAWAIDGLELDFPFELERREGGLEPADRRRQGRLAFREGRLSDITLAGVRSPLQVRGLTADLIEPIELAAAGGKVTLRGVQVDPGLGGVPRARTSVELAGLELRALTDAAGLPPLEGRFQASFPEVALEGAALRVDGGGRIDVFGGTVEIGDIAGEDVFSPFPRLRFSASFEEINLGQLTRTFSFGEISGVLEGYLRDCVLVGGAPVRFEAELRTVERRGVPRTIAVKAINNLAILGTGGEVSVLDRGLHRFLDKYTYSRLGIHAELRDDRFLLRGLERKGDKELFLDGRLPLPIDIVNARPGQAIGFRSMLDRFERIDFSAASTGEPGVD